MLRTAVLAIIMLLSGHALADQAELDQLRETIRQMFPGEQQYLISETQIPGLFEVDFGGSFMYITADAKYAVKGDIIKVSNEVNLTERKRAVERLKVVNAIGRDKMIIFSPPAETRRFSITVFTDIDCSYCRRMHSEIQSYLRQGVEVRYMFYPRAGVGSPSYQKAVSVWCADDRRKAMTLAKQGDSIEARTCDNPIDAQMRIAQQLGVRGTPLLILDDGTLQPGYVSAAQLVPYMEQQKRLAALN